MTQSLAEYKHRAHTAEMKLDETHTDVTRTQDLEKEIKEKNLLIGKLRHEGTVHQSPPCSSISNIEMDAFQ